MSHRPLIIVPVDGSQETERTVQYAVDLGKQRDADVHAIQVVPPDGPLWRAPWIETRLEARLEALQPAAEQEGVSVQFVTLYGMPERVIPAYAGRNAAHLLVVGHDYGSARRWRNSAVASRLGRSSPVPVLVVPARRDAAVPSSLNRIVAPVDFSVASALALRTAADLSQRHGARLTMLHALATPDHMVFNGSEAWRFAQRLPAEAKEFSERLKREAMALGARDAEPVVVTRGASQGIVETATDTDADLIVMGVSPRTWIDEAVSGSTLRAVLRHAPAPVLVLSLAAGACEWIQEDEEHSVRMLSVAGGMLRRAA